MAGINTRRGALAPRELSSLILGTRTCCTGCGAARRACPIIINAFTVTPRLEAQGQSGTLAAATLIDEIGRLTKSSHYGGTKRSVADGLEDKVQVDIPEMHISLGELRRLLHENLGHRLQIWGELLENSRERSLSLNRRNGLLVIGVLKLQ